MWHLHRNMLAPGLWEQFTNVGIFVCQSSPVWSVHPHTLILKMLHSFACKCLLGQKYHCMGMLGAVLAIVVFGMVVYVFGMGVCVWGGYFKVATGIVCVVFLERAWSVTVLFCCKHTVFMYCIHSVC